MYVYSLTSILSACGVKMMSKYVQKHEQINKEQAHLRNKQTYLGTNKMPNNI